MLIMTAPVFIIFFNRKSVEFSCIGRISHLHKKDKYSLKKIDNQLF